MHSQTGQVVAVASQGEKQTPVFTWSEPGLRHNHI